MRRKKGFLHSRAFLIGGTVVAILIAISAGRELYNNYAIQQEIQGLEDQAARLEARRLEFLELTQRLESGEFLEREARLEMGLRKPGEQVAVVQPSEAGENRWERGDRSNPQLWWDYFMSSGQH